MPQATASTPDSTSLDGVVAALMQTLTVLKSSALGTSVEGACLGVLHTLHAKGPLRPGDVATAVRLDASTVSRHLQALERLELVARERDPADGRAFRVAATEAGTATVREAAVARRELLSQALQGWDAADITQLEELLARMAADLTAVAGPTSSAEPTRQSSGKNL